MIKDFLKDVFICSLSAFGGPEAHYGVFTSQLVERKQYLSEAELLEWMALCTLLPGPSSTQVITAIGYQKGGVKLALLTLLVWALPIVLVMTGLTFVVSQLAGFSFLNAWVLSLSAMATAFVLFGGIKLSQKAVKDSLTGLIWLAAIGVTLFYRSFYIFPLVMAVGGIITALTSNSKIEPSSKTRIGFSKPLLIGVIAVIAFGMMHPLLGAFPLLQRFSVFSGFGSLVIGGGNVVIPYMIETLVVQYQWLTQDLFLAGLGFIQGMPGPMFGFSAWAGGLSYTNQGPIIQSLSALGSAVGLFLPGTLFIFLVAPVWPKIKALPWIKPTLKGVIAAAAGIILSTAWQLLMAFEFSIAPWTLLFVTLFLLIMKKVPIPFIVLFNLGLGLLIF